MGNEHRTLLAHLKILLEQLSFMRLFILSLFIFVLLVGCFHNAPSQPAPSPQPVPSPTPSPTPTPQPAPSPEPPAPVPQPAPSPSPVPEPVPTPPSDSVPVSSGIPSGASTACSDSDDSDDPLIVGTVTVEYTECGSNVYQNYGSWSDSCINSNTVQEVSCSPESSDFYTTKSIACPNGQTCSGGKCMSST